MSKKSLILSLFTCSVLFAESIEPNTLQEELQKQQESIELLTQKVQVLQNAQQSQSKRTNSFSQSEYLPEIAFVLNMSAVARDVTNTEYENYAIPGFIDANDTEEKIPFNKNRGFNFNYMELAFHSVVDPYFDAFAILHIAPDALAIEEAYVTTRALPAGLRVKAGKFRSGFGRINEKHQHSWDFDEQNLAYKAFFGADGISDAGVQLQWLAPTDTYLMFGAEGMQGSNEQSFGYKENPNLVVAYSKVSVDVGDDFSFLGGVSFAHGQTEQKENSNVYGVDATLREQLGSYSALTWQSEFLQRDKAGVKQSGLYTQLVYQYDNNYKVGGRYDALLQNTAGIRDNLDRVTLMGEYKPFEMSRLRLEYSYDRSKKIDNRYRDIQTVMLTLNIAAGAHGAHAY